MKKSLKFGIIGILGLIVIGFIVLTLTIDSIVQSGIEEIGSEMTGTQVTVSGVSISPFSGKGTISGFRVANPEGFSGDYSVEIDDFSIELDIYTLFSDVIIVRDITMISPSIRVEQKMPENNIKAIMDHINSIDSGEASESEMVIEHFLLENGRVDLYTEIGGERSAQVEIETIELNDLGRGGGRQAVEDVVREIADEVGEKVLRAAVQSGGEQIRDAVRDLFN
jgi:uncharacterized protein involved in outer membrane biogenesis